MARHNKNPSKNPRGQKVFKTGNSLVVVIPAGFKKVLDIKEGDCVQVEANIAEQSLTYKFPSARQLTFLNKKSRKAHKK